MLSYICFCFQSRVFHEKKKGYKSMEAIGGDGDKGGMVGP